MNMQFVEAIKRHANANYETDGWDYVVETFTDEEIWKEVKDCVTEQQAIAKMKELVELLDERRRDIQSTAW